ncbi:MAG: D-alanine--D-alanine ligase [Actinomycetota bacterium]|nr:D-alanine--D-alanine ligase [Actinomycetota bacterium]
MTRVAVLAGGRSHEREVSLRSGHRVLAALGARGHDATLVDPADVPLVETLSSGGFEVCAIALHGRDGEDGTVQRLLETLGLPYTGTAPFACQVAFDKVLAKEALRAHGISTPPWATVQASALRDLSAGAILSAVVERVGLPAVVKPARGGSAMGLGFVEREADLPAAVMAALSFADAAVVESKVLGIEVGASIVGSPPEVLPLVEIVPKSGVYDYAARYTPGATDYFAPARLDPAVAAASAALASSAFAALSLRDVARADLIVHASAAPTVLEVNVSPGMTETSLVPMAAHAAGMELPDLWERLILLAAERGRSTY